MGTLLILGVYANEMTGIQNYRNILDEYPEYDLILLTNDTVDRLELLGRSYSEHEKFYRWNFKDGKVKTYIASDLIDTSYWQLFQGTKQIYYNEKSPLNYTYDSKSAKIIIGIDYFEDSRHTKYVGRMERVIEVYPEKNKETLNWYPKNKSIKYNIQWVHETDHLRESKNLKGSHKTDLEKLQINWNDSIDKVSSSRQYLNGKVKVRYLSEYGDQVIDPRIKIGGLIIDYDFANGYGVVDYTPQCFKGEVCHLPMRITLNRNLVLSEQMMSKFFKTKDEEFKSLQKSGINIYQNYTDDVDVWVDNITCVTETTEFLNNITQELENRTQENCTDNGNYVTQTITTEEWRTITYPFTIEKDKEYLIDQWGVKDKHEDIDAFVGINGVQLYRMAWWHGSWDYKKEIQIDGTSLEIPDNYQLKLEVPYTSNMNTTFQDWRVVNSTDTGVLNYWVEKNTTSTNATIWIKIPEISNSSNTTIYEYYGNDVATTTSSATNTLGANIQDFWTFSGDAGDRIGSHDGSVTGATLTTGYRGDANNAYDFDGNDEIVVTDHSDFDLQNNFTISMWVYVDDLSAVRGLISKFWDGSTRAWESYITTAGTIVFLIRPSGDPSDTSILSDTGTISTGSWYHIAIRYNSTKYQWFVNGSYSGTAITKASPNTNNANVNFGDRSHTSSHLYLDGKIDDLRIYTRDLTDSEISSLYSPNGASINYSFGAEQTENTAPTITANSTSPSTVYTDTDLLTNVTVTDPEGDTLTVYVQHYVNDTAVGGVISTIVTNNTNTLVATLGSGNYSAGDNISSEFWAGDGTVNTSKSNMTFTGVHQGCGTLSSSGTYTLTANVSSTGTCFTISSDDIILDGAGYTINYSKISTGYGIYNSGGYDNITIKNLNIVQDNLSVSNSYGIRTSGMLNSIIQNITITTYGSGGRGIYVAGTSDSNNITNNTITTTNTNGYGLYLSFSDSNNVFDNIISTTGSSGFGIYIVSSESNQIYRNDITTTTGSAHPVIMSSSTSNELINNTLSTTGSTAYGISLSSSTSNNIIGGSIDAQTKEDYSLSSSGDNNNFTDTGFFTSREISFSDTSSWFNYNNETDGSIFVKTKVSTTGSLDRTLINWTQTNMTWTETASTSLTATYNVTSLNTNTNYNVSNSTTSRLIETDGTGKLTVDIYLTSSVETTIIIALPSDSCSCPSSGNWDIDCSDNCVLTSCDMQTNNFTITGTGTVFGFTNIYNYVDGYISGNCIVRE